MNYLQMCQKVRQEIGEAGTGPTSVLNQAGMLKNIVDWVADADVETQSLYLDWDFLWRQFSAATNSSEIIPPPTVAAWDLESFCLDINTDNHKHLPVMDYRAWRRHCRPGVNAPGTPDTVIILPNKNLILEPAPAEIRTLTADYWRTPVRMTANDDISVVPTQYHRVVICRAKMYYAEYENAPEIMQSAVGEYNRLLRKLEALALPGRRDNSLGTADLQVVVE